MGNRYFSLNPTGHRPVATLETEGIGPLTRPSADLSPRGEVEKTGAPGSARPGEELIALAPTETAEKVGSREINECRE
jgi:hypothetical protein